MVCSPLTYRFQVSTFFHGRLSTAVVMAMTFGYDFPPENKHDRFVALAEETSNGIARLFLPGSTLINVLPFLKHIPPWVPGASTQKFAAHLSESMNAYRTEPFAYVERDLVSVPMFFSRTRWTEETCRQLDHRNHPCWRIYYGIVPRLMENTKTRRFSRI